MIWGLFKKKPSPYSCKWNDPWKQAPWEFQSCQSDGRREKSHCSDTMIDFSCNGIECGHFEVKDEA